MKYSFFLILFDLIFEVKNQIILKKKKKESTVQVFEISWGNEWKKDRCIAYVSTYIELRIQK